VLEALRDRYPDLLIENCSQGGNRADFGMLRYTDAAWMDDRTVPSVHVRHNLEGLMTFFPPAYLLSFEVDHSEEPVAGAADLELLLRSRMMGILGLTYRAAELDDADRERLAREIGVYKTLREITRDASGAVLTGQAEPDGGPAWDGVQEQSAATGESVIFAFQNDGAARAVTLRPHGLDNDGIYAIANAGGARIGTARGADLMLDGIRIEESPESAARVLVLRPLERRPGGPQ
jgi:alpha-galactosidase